MSEMLKPSLVPVEDAEARAMELEEITSGMDEFGSPCIMHIISRIKALHSGTLCMHVFCRIHLSVKWWIV
jgi:hypothetical protein